MLPNCFRPIYHHPFELAFFSALEDLLIGRGTKSLEKSLKLHLDQISAYALSARTLVFAAGCEGFPLFRYATFAGIRSSM